MKKDKALIPKGDYCYDDNGICPYWMLVEDRPYQYNGYCSFIEKGDWDINSEKEWENCKTGEIETGDEIGLPMSLLWDQIKECGMNNEYEIGEDND